MIKMLSRLFQPRERFFLVLGGRRYQITTERRDDTIHPAVAAEIMNAYAKTGYVVNARVG